MIFHSNSCSVSLVLAAVSCIITMQAALTFCKCAENVLLEREYIPVYSNGTIVPSQSPQAKWLIQIVYYSSHAVLFLQLSKLGICRKDFFKFNQCNWEKKSIRFTEPLQSLFAIGAVVICLIASVFAKRYQAINN